MRFEDIKIGKRLRRSCVTAPTGSSPNTMGISAVGSRYAIARLDGVAIP